jgi:DNA-binding response OmpR family regulator
MASALTGKRILVVEDEYFIASDLKRALAAANAIVVGPIGDVAKGLAIAAGEPLDAAVLDVNLEGAHSYSVADALAAREVPFLFVTGYDGWALPETYRQAPRVAKPFVMSAVIARVEALFREKTR